MMTRLPLVLLAVLALVSTPAAEAHEKPNIVFILADDLGYGDLGCFGQEKIKTPNLDALAEEGMRFTQFYAGSTVCAPSRCVLMTGLHLGHCYIRGNGKIDLRPEDVTFAESLQKAGYRTGLSGKWGLGHEGSTGLPTRQGFDHFFGYLDQHHAHNYYPSFLISGEERVQLKNVVPKEMQYGNGVATKKVDYSHDLVMADALNFVRESREEPFFLFLSLTIPHANNEAGRDGMEVPDLGQYAEKDWPHNQKAHAAMISRMDRDVGRLVDLLEELQLDEDTLILFSSDNGPHREGGNNPDFADSNGPLRGIKRAMYEGGIRVPTIARWPGHVPAGTESDFIGSFVDIFPTFCELAEAEMPKDRDGISFVPTLLGRADEQKEHEYLYWEFYEQGSKQALRMGDWKLIVRPMFGENVELYDLSKDIGESNNIADQHPAQVKRMREVIRQAHVPNPLWKIPSKKKPSKKKPARKPSAANNN